MPDAGDALDAALDDLYDVDPAEFTATRTRLAASLRADDPAAAKALKAARRPTTAAWALNRVSRDEPALVADYFDRSRELRAAQTGTSDGGRDALRSATRAQRDALARLTDATLARLGDRANEGYRAQIAATLHAAIVDVDVEEQMRRGRLVKEVSGTSGFPEIPDLSIVPPLPEERTRPRKRPPRPRGGTTARNPEPAPDPDAEARPEAAARAANEEAAAEREARAERARRELEAAEIAADDARATADAAEAAAEAAHTRARTLEDDLAQARREAREADSAAARARREAAQLARAATKLRSRAPKG